MGTFWVDGTLVDDGEAAAPLAAAPRAAAPQALGAALRPAPVVAPSAAPIPELERPLDEDEALDQQLMVDVDLRLEVGALYKQFLAGNLFDVDTAAARTVQRRIRKFVHDELQSVLGMRAPARASVTGGDFTPEEVAALKSVAARLLGSVGGSAATPSAGPALRKLSATPSPPKAPPQLQAAPAPQPAPAPVVPAPTPAPSPAAKPVTPAPLPVQAKQQQVGQAKQQQVGARKGDELLEMSEITGNSGEVVGKVQIVRRGGRIWREYYLPDGRPKMVTIRDFDGRNILQHIRQDITSQSSKTLQDLRDPGQRERLSMAMEILATVSAQNISAKETNHDKDRGTAKQLAGLGGLRDIVLKS